MNTVIEAVFDGAVFRPVEPLTLKPNIRVRIIIETVQPTAISSFLRTARSLTLDGPSDWSLNLENYLYGDKTDD